MLSSDEDPRYNVPLVTVGEFNRMSPEQQSVQLGREYYHRHPITHFPTTEDPDWELNTWPEWARPQIHPLGSRIFITEEDKAIQRHIEEKFREQYGDDDFKTWEIFPVSRQKFKEMKDELEASEKDPENMYTINVYPSLYLDEEWLTKGELFEPTKWEILKERMGIETPIETIDVLAKEKAELDEWRRKKGFFELPPNYRQIMRVEPQDIWSKEQEEKAVSMIKQTFPSLSDEIINQVREEAMRRASIVAQVWTPLLYGGDSAPVEAAIDYNLRDLSWIPETKEFTDEKRKEMDWYLETEIRKILQGIGHFTELELGPAPPPPDSIKKRFHLTPEQYLYYKSYFEEDPIPEYSTAPEFFPKLKTENEQNHDPWALQDIDLERYHEPEYKEELRDRLTQFADDAIERQDLIATFRNYGMTIRKDENEVYLKRMQQDPFFDEDARDRVEIDEKFKKAPWRDEIEDYDEDLVDIPGFMFPRDPLRSSDLPLDESNAPFNTKLIPLDIQRKIQSEHFIDSADMLWPVNNYYSESGFDPRELEETDVDTFRQLLLDVFPEKQRRHHPDEQPLYTANSTERTILERAEKLFNHFAYLKRAVHRNNLWYEEADNPTLQQKIGMEPMPTLKRKHPVIDYIDAMTSAANKIWYDKVVREPSALDYEPLLDLTSKSVYRLKLKLKDEKIREYISQEPVFHQVVPRPTATTSVLDRPVNEASLDPRPMEKQMKEIEKKKEAILQELSPKVDKEIKDRSMEYDDLARVFEIYQDFGNPPSPKPEWFSVPDPKPQLTLDDLGLVPYKLQIEQTITAIESHPSIPRILTWVKFYATKYGIDQWNLEQLYAAAEISTVIVLTPLTMIRIQSFVSPSAKARFRSALRWIPFSPSVTSVFILKKLIKWGLRAMGLQTIIYFPIACFAMNLMDNLATNVLIRNTDPITAAVEMYKEYGWRAIIRGLPWKILTTTADVLLDHFTQDHPIFNWLDSKSYNLVSRLWPWDKGVLERIQHFGFGLLKRLVLSPFAYLRYRSYVSDPNRQTRRVWPSALSVLALVPVSLIEYTIRYFIKSTLVPYIALANPPKVLDYSQKWALGTGPVRIHTPIYPAWERELFSNRYWAL